MPGLSIHDVADGGDAVRQIPALPRAVGGPVAGPARKVGRRHDGGVPFRKGFFGR